MVRVPVHNVLEMKHCTEGGVVSAIEPAVIKQKEHSRNMGIEKASVASDSLQEALEEADSLLRSMEIGNTKMSLQRTLSHPPELSASFQAKLSHRLSQPQSHRVSHRTLKQQLNSSRFVSQTQTKRIFGNNVKGIMKLLRPSIEYADLQHSKYSSPKSLQVFDEHKNALNNPFTFALLTNNPHSSYPPNYMINQFGIAFPMVITKIRSDEQRVALQYMQPMRENLIGEGRKI